MLYSPSAKTALGRDAIYVFTYMLIVKARIETFVWGSGGTIGSAGPSAWDQRLGSGGIVTAPQSAASFGGETKSVSVCKSVTA